jgi:hypothetical protein
MVKGRQSVQEKNKDGNDKLLRFRKASLQIKLIGNENPSHRRRRCAPYALFGACGGELIGSIVSGYESRFTAEALRTA